MILVIMFTTATLTVISLITVSNLIFFHRLKVTNEPLAETPLVSVMIPARNEAEVIGRTIQHLLRQDYATYEILLLDDNSDDNTGQIARDCAQENTRLTVMSGQPLPDSWMGKNWACHQMAQQAKGDILLFTDADVIWAGNAISSLVRHMQETKADLFTVWPTQHTVTWAERLTVSLMALVVLGYLPVIGSHYVPMSVFGAANGQCMAWKRDAYEKLGGHQVVSDNVLEDVTLARMVKAAGMRLRMADGNRLVSCRMYTGWASVRDGYAKNILAGYGSAPALIGATIFHLLVFIFPWLWLITQFPATGWPEWPIALIMLGLSVRVVTASYTHQRLQDAVLMPVSVILMTRIAFQALWWQYTQGGPSWKGRVVRKQPAIRKAEHD